jgi:hypothetical protein
MRQPSGAATPSANVRKHYCLLGPSRQLPHFSLEPAHLRGSESFYDACAAGRVQRLAPRRTLLGAYLSAFQVLLSGRAIFPQSGTVAVDQRRYDLFLTLAAPGRSRNAKGTRSPQLIP